MPRRGGVVSTQAPTKIAIISCGTAGASFEIKLYLVHTDISKEEQRHVEPVLQFLFPFVNYDAPAVCFLNSTLYIFDGFCPSPANPTFPDDRNRAYKFVCSSENLDLVRHTRTPEMENGTFFCPMNPIKKPMNHVKASPRAIPTPDGKKVLVFSTLFHLKDSGKAFELFDPDNESWETLPAFPCTDCCKLDPDIPFLSYQSLCYCTENYYVNLGPYSFIGKSVFYVEMTFRAFSLDLTKEKKEWVSHGIPIAPFFPSHPARYFETVMGRYVIVPRDESVYEDDGSLVCDGRDPALCVYDLGEDVFLCPRVQANFAKYAIGYLDPQVVLPLSPFGPPRDSLWLLPVPPITIFPIQEEIEREDINTFFVVQQLDGIQYGEGERYDCIGETRYLIEVCRTDSNHNHTVSKAVSFTTRFSDSPGTLYFFAA